MMSLQPGTLVNKTEDIEYVSNLSPTGQFTCFLVFEEYDIILVPAKM
jgi:hypothetical protein